MLRFLGEEYLRSKQSKLFYLIILSIGKGKECWSKFNDSENLSYHLILLQMYLLGCLKWPNFNPDSALRIKLFWTRHSKNKKQNKSFDICPCMYGIDNKSLISIIDGNLRRQDEIDIQLKKYFESSDNGSSYKLKGERQKEVMAELSNFHYSERLWDDIEKSWKIKLAKE